ncbi:structural maintenance of chromosomes flexible hinge domain-containing protein 1 [Oncorhynchus tshawytscha]|uniref:structural maintenance of chromosomes flexible hinge domain-containing protein 1 n=1 Tax=Oncorhynchus tshawytscha TaxID=74940 RepID=UPI000D0A4468|nr:structural maintenance of chromosomes flexible hinge domain-containing protein 1 [Oncorhynchus tshawytscha]
MAESEGVTTSAVANSNRTHISQSKNGVNGSDKPHNSVVIFDCRPERHDAMERVLDINGLDFNDFLQVVSKEFAIPSNETFVLTTTDRKGIDFDRYENLQQGNTLHLLQTEDQILPVATKEHIVFLPHYDTLVQSGMYEYYASEGQNSLPYAFAELIDNALSATSHNTGVRTIDIRLLFDESLGKHAVVIMDNGCGMTSKQLNNWAVYRLSKFSRESGTFSSDHAGYVRPDPVARSLNSDISYFGVGGKQAVFYIGQSTRMITKPAGSPDVHELIISKEEFERKERNKEDIYSGFIRNRKMADSSHVRDDEERFLHGLIAEEVGKDSFTAVVVTGVQPEHVTFLKQDFHLWTRELAHLYHYYIHGLNGNDMKASYRNSDCVSNIDIQISLLEKFPKIPRMVNLREIDNDMQTLYINTSADTFEFKACTDVDGIVEGVLRYHPFLYDRETYPEDPYAIPATEEDDDSIVLNQARGKRPIFECFWNGRLIPYTTVSEFDWCAWPKKTGTVPAECYSRFSGVLFTNDRFQVSTNKLTFMDLELQLKNKETLFTRIVNGQEQRVKIHKEFHQWLKTCHEKWDKQVKFRGFKRTITRTDVTTKKMQSPWATFSSIEWDGRAYKAGQYVKSQKTQPIFFGSVIQFLLYGDHEGDVYATGGQVQVAMEPKALYDDIKTIPISKIDRVITNAAIKKSIDDELAKLPDKLKVTWPEGNPWTQNDVRPAGTPLGPLHVEILNKKGESISRIPSAMQNTTRKALLIELKVVWHSPNGDVETNSHIAAHSAKWAFWFRTMENLNKLGKYTLHLNTILNVNESNATVWAGNRLPNHTLDFSITEGSAERFMVGTVNTLLHVGVPFHIPLELLDEYGHPARPPPNLKPLLECSALEVSYEGVTARGTILTIRGVRARGAVQHYQSKTHDLKVVLPGLKQDSQTLKISLLPGNPDSLKVKQEDPITVENGTSVSFDVEVHDVAGNVTAHPKLIISCQLQGIPGSSSMVAVDCSNTGAGTLVLKPITFKNIAGDQTVKATFDIPSQKSVAPVQRDLRVVPSTRVSRLEVYSQEDEDSLVDSMMLRDKEKIDWTAGDLLENLHYRLYDERGRVVPLSEEMARRIKVNWAADVSVEELAQGKLPNVPVPTLVKEEHFYQVSYMEELVSVDTSFTIVPRPDEPKHMKATLSESTVRMGEVLSGKIFLQLTDQYGNKTQMLTATCVDSLAVDAEGLDKASLVFTWQESTHSMLVTGVRFNPGFPGIRELNFTWRDFAEHVTIKLTAGVPAQLKLVDGPQEPLQVLNEQGIQTPFLLQLFDEWGNPSPDQRVVVTLKTSTPALKVKSPVNSQPIDKDGKASFVVDHVSGPKGEYALEFRGSFNKKPIHGPAVKLTIIPDPNKPVKLVVEYNTNSVFPAGGTLTVFSVSVMSEEGSTIKNLNPANMSMLLWKGEPSGTSRPPSGAAQLKCSKPMEDEKANSFHFRDKVIPDHVGKYTIQFVLCVDKTKGLWSHQYVINVVPNDPVKLAPDLQPPTPVVVNNNVLDSRTLVEDMSLKLMDMYNNSAGLELSGKVVVTIKSSKGSSDKNLPLFEGKVKSLQFSLANGEAQITNLFIMENSPGQDGNEYVLLFRPSVPGYGPKNPLAAFELPFRFYNDVENRKQMSELTKKKDQLKQTVDIYRSLFDTNRQLITELSNQVRNATNKESHLKSELGKNGMAVAQLSSIPAIDKVIGQKTADAEKMKLQTRRVCAMPDPFRGNLDVLGKIGHLALVEDDDVATVISWHLLGDIDCVVTMTTVAARKIYDDTQGKQQVMPLDTVFWRKNSSRPLPHIRNGRDSFRPIGNPVFARDLLIFPENAENCHIVFGNLLGDTILTDDLDSANHYRKGVVQSKVPCPTLLTRQGDRIRSNGKFGGLQNKAPPIERLRGQVFGAPLPKDYHTFMGQIDLLQQYRLAMEKSRQVQEDFDGHMQYLKSPEMVQKEEEMDEQEKQLKDIETKLASTPVRTPSAIGVKRSLDKAGESSGMVTKRTRRKLLKQDY